MTLFIWNWKKKATQGKEVTQDKKKSSETEAVEKDKDISVSLLNIQVGLIRKAWKHPSADRCGNKLFSFSLQELVVV